MTDAATQPLLHCLDGHAAPPELAKGIEVMTRLTAPHRERFVELLESTRERMPDDQLDNRIGRLCRRHELPLDLLGPSIKVARFLFRQAAIYDVGADALAEDLAALGGSALTDWLLGLYESCKPKLRSEIAQAALLAHGRVLTGVEWRMDTIGSTNLGRNINLPVAVLTLAYRDGERTERVSLQLIPDMVRGLRNICNLLLGEE